MNDNLPKPKASTQEHLDIEDIIQDLVILKTGWVALVMNTTAVNFDLLSEAEQDATIYAYGAFLNSLTFPVEILIRSKKADISAYFQTLKEAERVQPNPDLKRQIQKYEDFIQATVQQRTVLDKKFYIVINYSSAATGFGGIGKKAALSAKTKARIIETAKANMAPRRDHVTKQLARLGLVARQLTSQELVELFYDIYNPAPTGTQRVILDSTSYTAPLVEPAIENPKPTKMPTFENVSGEVGEGVLQEPGLSPHVQVPVGQGDTVVEVGLRPVPPRNGEPEISENQNVGQPEIGNIPGPAASEDQRVGEGTGQKEEDIVAASVQPAAQSEALKGLQQAVAQASKLTVSSAAGNQNNSDEDQTGSGGFKI